MSKIRPSSEDFVAVHKDDSENVFFLRKGRIVRKSIEPDYREHRKTEKLNLLKRLSLLLAIGLIAVLAYIILLYNTNIGITLLLIANIVGLSVSWLFNFFNF